MEFLTRLWSPKTKDVVARLKKIGNELDVAQKRINALAGTADTYIKEDENNHRARVLEAAILDYGLAMWVKDIDSHFIFVNKVCCDMILKCTVEEALAARDDDLAEDALAVVCLKSDHATIEQRATLRFLEHGIYNNEHVVLDSIKSPFYGDKDTIAGTLGSAHDITADIPCHVLRDLKPCSAEIPVAEVLCRADLIKYLKNCE